MAVDKDIIKLLDEFNKNLVDDTRVSLQAKLDERAAEHKGKKVKSRLWASVYGAPAIYQNGNIIIKLTMNDYWAVVNNGRSPNNVSEDGQAKIAEWSDTRGFAEKIRISDLDQRKKDQQERKSKSNRKLKLKTLKKMPFERAKKAAGFLVARSLKNKSIEPTHFFDNVIDDGRIQELQDKLTELIKSDIIIEIRSSYT